MSKLARAIAEAITTEYTADLPDSPDHEFSPAFERKMDKLIKRRSLPFYMLINTAGKRIAGIVIGIIIALSAAVISVDALREGFVDFITMVFSDHSVVKPVETENAPETIEEIYGITADLSGYEIVYESYDDTSVRIDYIKDDVMIIFRQHIKTATLNHNTENSEFSEININGYNAIYYCDNHNYNKIVWDNDSYTIYLSSNIGKNELIEIAESVQKTE